MPRDIYRSYRKVNFVKQYLHLNILSFEHDMFSLHYLWNYISYWYNEFNCVRCSYEGEFGERRLKSLAVPKNIDAESELRIGHTTYCDTDTYLSTSTIDLAVDNPVLLIKLINWWNKMSKNDSPGPSKSIYNISVGD